MTIPLRKSHPLFKILNGADVDLPAPANILALWDFGSLLGRCRVIQTVTGLFLAIHYTADVNLAFSSVTHICRWFLRTLHANEALFFFICLFVHIGRGIYYDSFLPSRLIRRSCYLLLLVITTTFLVYDPPWGQIAFWGATVIAYF